METLFKGATFALEITKQTSNILESLGTLIYTFAPYPFLDASQKTCNSTFVNPFQGISGK